LVLLTNNYDAIITLLVRGSQVQEQEIEAVVDTGFDGWLSLPPTVIPTLRLPFRRRGLAVLANGSETLFDIYEGTVIWDEQPRRIMIDYADTDPLVGMSLLYGYSLAVQVVEGGSVIINILSQQKPIA
jgi:clan AA aspartic protease